MDPNECFIQIKKLDKINTKQELREFCELNIDQILKHLPTRILNSDGEKIIECILKGLSDNSRYKLKVIDLVLKLLREKPMPLTCCGKIVSRITLELSRLPIDSVLKWSNDSVQTVLHDADVNMVWRDILPECLNVICTYKTVNQSGGEMSGTDYKVQCIHTLCQCPWKEKQLVQLTAMFKDIQLSKESHKQVVNKICSYIVSLPPDTLPPLVPQLLSLCKVHNLEIVLSHLSHYFNVYIYNNLEAPVQDSESTTMDVDDIAEYSPVELSQCLSTCLYHISQGMADPELIRKHIKQWPKTQTLRCPFIIDVALAISVKGSDFKSVCLDVIKSAIELQIQDDLRSKDSEWVSAVLPPDVDAVNVLKALAKESANHRPLTVLGLIELSFSLLRVRNRDSAPRCRGLGRMLLVALCRAQPETAPHILSQLADSLAGDSTHSQYADCLHALCEKAPVSIERCSQVTLIVEGCQGPDASLTYEALRPLLSFSERTRDTLVKVCRKHLYSRDSVHRRLAVSGFLAVLRHTRWSGGWQRSQDPDEHSYLTQLTVDLHHHAHAGTSRARNEIVCLEIVSILRRCFVQDAAVKQFLYNEIYSCVKDKKALHEPILELLYEHLSKYISEDSEEPILLDECITKNAVLTINFKERKDIVSLSVERTIELASVELEQFIIVSVYSPPSAHFEQFEKIMDEVLIKLLNEPIGHLLYTVAQFLQIEEEESEDVLDSQTDNPLLYLKNKLTTMMQKLCQADWLVMVNMDEPVSDLTPESKIKSVKVQQILQCYEALIAHQIMQWSSLNANANSVHSMLKAHNQLLESTKVPSKLSKKTKLNETRESGKSPKKSKKSQKTQNTPKEAENDEVTEKKPVKKKGKAPVTLASASKDKGGPFKPLPCLWDQQLALRVLELLYSEEVSWSSLEQRNQIRSKREFHLFALRSIHSTINDKMDRRLVSTLVLKSAALLYSRCISRFSDVYRYDEFVTLACLELFRTCLTTLLSHNYTFKTDVVIMGIAGSKSSESRALADILDALYSCLNYLETENAEASLDAVGKKTFAILVQISTTLLEMPVKAFSDLSEVLLRLGALWSRSGVAESLPLAAGVLRAGARSDCDAPLLERLLRRLAHALEYISEEELPATQDTEDFPCIDAKTGHSMLALVCAHLGDRYKCTEHLLARAKDLAAAVGYATEQRRPRVERELKELYSSVQLQLCQLSSWTGLVARLRCCVGAGSDKVLALCVRLYSLLAAFVKQLGLNMAQTIHLERLLKLTGRKLSHICDDLVTYVTASQNPRTIIRDTKMLPRLVKETEAFNANVMLMRHNDYQKYLSLGTARDFKINAISQQRIEELEPAITQDTIDDDDASTVVLDNSHLEESDDSDSEEEIGRKKRRTS